MKKNLIIICLFTTVIICCSAQKKNICSAKITALSGQIIVFNEKNSVVRSKIGMRILPSYTIVVRDKSRCALQIGSTKAVLLYGNTIVRAMSLIYDEKTMAEQTYLNLKKGKISVKIFRLMEKNGFFLVKTPAVIAGVRGTEFCAETAAGGDDIISVASGSVKIRRNIKILDDETGKAVARPLLNAISNIAENDFIQITVDQQFTVNRRQNEKFNQAIENVIEKNSERMDKIETALNSRKDSLSPEIIKKAEETLVRITGETLASVTAEQQKEKISSLTPVKINAAELPEIMEIRNYKIHTEEKIQKPADENKPAASPVLQSDDKMEKYTALVQEADRLFESRKFTESRKEYARAAAVIPEMDYPAGRIAEINRLLTQKKSEEKKQPSRPGTTLPQKSPVPETVPPPAPPADLPKKPGMLNLEFDTGAEALITGPGLKEKISTGTREIPPGVYTLEISAPGYETQFEDIIIAGGETVNKTVKLKKKITVEDIVILLDGSEFKGKIISQNENYIIIDTADGQKNIQRSGIFEIRFIGK